MFDSDIPSKIIDDSINADRADSIFNGDFTTASFIWNIFSFYFVDLGSCQLCPAMFFAFCATILFSHIFQIIGLGTEKQMIWVHASRIIAGMANSHSFWNRAIVNFIRNSGADMGFPLNHASSVNISGSNPKPTAFGFLDLLPKQFLVMCAIHAMFFTSSVSIAQSYFQGNNLIEVPVTTVTSGTTVTLNSLSKKIRNYTGSTAQTIVLPDATTLQNGRPFIFVNNSSATITIQYNDASTALTLLAGNSAYFSLNSNATTNGSWIISGTQTPLTIGSLTDAGTDGITVTNGAGSVIGTGTSFAQHVADTSHNGYLASSDWNTFNGKQAAGSYITALTGGVTASGPGSAVATVVTNANLTGGVTSVGNAATVVTNANLTGPITSVGNATSVASQTGTGSTFVMNTSPTLSNPIVGTQLSSDNSTLAASTAYVQTALAQLNPAAAVVAASTATIAGTYTNAVSGVCIGDTFTTTATTAFALDGQSPSVGSRVLLKNQTSTFQDGVWVLTTQAVGSVSGAILTRATDFDSSADLNSGSIVPVVSGTVNAGSSWYQTATNTTCNTSTQTWTQFQPATSAFLLAANNLSDVATKATAFNNISPMTTAGDLIYGGASGAATRLAIGTAGQALTVNGGATGFTYANVLTNPMTTANDIIIGGTSGAPARSILIPPISQGFGASGTLNLQYAFIVSSANATTGATYTNNSITFTVFRTISSGTLIYMSGSNVPTASGTLTKASGTGDSTITFASYRAPIGMNIQLVGGGGGGGSTGSGGTGCTSGGASSIGTTLITALGGACPSAATGGAGGADGTIGLGGPTSDGITLAGAPGGSCGFASGAGAKGGDSYFGGGGTGGTESGAPGGAGVNNTGGGGGGAATVGDGCAAGGGAGSYSEAFIGNPAGTYSYTIGAGGNGNGAGSGGQAGGAGATGAMYVKFSYQ